MILTQEQELIRDSMRAFAQERLAPFAAEWDRNHTFPREALSELAELGALGMVVPEEWDGAGMDYMSLVLTLEEIAAGDGATSTIVSVQNSMRRRKPGSSRSPAARSSAASASPSRTSARTPPPSAPPRSATATSGS